jgi:DNA-binding MarR family transcriptional regulator
MDANAVKQIRQLNYVVDEFRKIGAEMPMQQAASFLTVALREGMTITEIAQLTGQTSASATRNIQTLGKTLRGKPGLELVVVRPDPTDGRRKSVHLTRTGEALIVRLRRHLTSDQELHLPPTPAITKVWCPSCASLEGVPLIWGFPNEEAGAAAGRAELVIGGCDLPIVNGPIPNVQCLKCEQQWHEPAADS